MTIDSSELQQYADMPKRCVEGETRKADDMTCRIAAIDHTSRMNQSTKSDRLVNARMYYLATAAAVSEVACRLPVVCDLVGFQPWPKFFFGGGRRVSTEGAKIQPLGDRNDSNLR